MTAPLFDPGHVGFTVAARGAIRASGDDPWEILAGHVMSDWGDLDDEDEAEKEYALNRHLRLFSAYPLTNGQWVWVITKADRGATTFLLPDEHRRPTEMVDEGR